MYIIDIIYIYTCSLDSYEDKLNFHRCIMMHSFSNISKIFRFFLKRMEFVKLDPPNTSKNRIRTNWKQYQQMMYDDVFLFF